MLRRASKKNKRKTKFGKFGKLNTRYVRRVQTELMERELKKKTKGKK